MGSIIPPEKLERLRDFFKTNMLPDIATVYYRTYTQNDAGAWADDAKVYREYDGTRDIPCRIDDKPFVRYMAIEGQETNVNQFQIYFPHDFSPSVGDIITVNGKSYEMKKTADNLSWDWLNEGTAVQVTVGDEDLDNG